MALAIADVDRIDIEHRGSANAQAIRKRHDRGPRQRAGQRKKPEPVPANGSSRRYRRARLQMFLTMQANRQEQMSEEAAVNPYYNNFFSTYRSDLKTSFRLKCSTRIATRARTSSSRRVAAFHSR
jgi:hypothetical protein